MFTLHLVQAPAQHARQDVDAAADADDGLLGGGRAVELFLHADQRGPENLAQLGRQLGRGIQILCGVRQDVVDGVTGTQSLERSGQMCHGKLCDGGLLTGELLLPVSRCGGELNLIGLRVLGALGLKGRGVLGQLSFQA